MKSSKSHKREDCPKCDTGVLYEDEEGQIVCSNPECENRIKK